MKPNLGYACRNIDKLIDRMTNNRGDGTLHVLVVEDDRFFQLVIRESLSQLVGDCVLKICSSANQALMHCRAASTQLDLALIDLGLPDADGVAVIREVVQRFPQVPVIVLSVNTNEDKVLQAVRAGATGYLLKGDTNLSVTRGIEQALHGVHPISPSIAGYFLKLVGREKPLGSSDIGGLTPRELDLLNQFANGKSYNEAAEAMGISLTTVQTHTRNLYRKLGVRSGLHAISKAREHGLI